MAANATDYFAKPGTPGTATTLAAPGHTIGGTTFNVGSTSNMATDTGVFVSVDTVTLVNGEEVRDPGSLTVWEMTVTNATTLSNAVLRYGTDQNYPAGSTTRVYISVSAAWANRLIDGLLISHDQDGTLKAGAVDNAAVLASNVVEEAKIKDAAVTTAKIADGAVTAAKVNFGGAGSGIWWQEIGRATAGSNVTTLTVSSLPARKYMKIIYTSMPTAATSTITLQFNGDSTTNYNYRLSDNGGADSTGAFAGLPVDNAASPGSGSVILGEIEGVNISGYEKPFLGHVLDTFAVGSNSPRRREIQGKWRGTAVISSVTITFSASQSAGTELVILGHD